MTIHFKTDFTVNVTPAKGERLVKALEAFIVNLSKIGPMPSIEVEVREDV